MRYDIAGITLVIGFWGVGTSRLQAEVPARDLAPAVATIEREGDLTQAVALAVGEAELRFYRSLWQAVSVRTPAGQTLRLTDPLFYSTQQNDQPTGQAAYWTRPESWDEQLQFTEIDRTEAPGQPVTVRIEGRRPGLVKEVHLTQYPGESMVYVVNRLRIEQAATVHDPHLIYLAREVDNTMHLSELTLDGTIVDTEARVGGQRGAFLYLGTSNVSLGVALAPPVRQRVKLQEMLQHVPQKTGRELRIEGVTGQALNAGETIEMRYALRWEDEHQLRAIHAWIGEVADGKHDDRFYPAALSR